MKSLENLRNICTIGKNNQAMIEGQKRREIILEELSKATKNVNATQLAEKFGVSRQIVVGDIALLRASGIEIISNSRGYQGRV